MITKEVQEIFEHYLDVAATDEAAAILTLAEILSRKSVTGVTGIAMEVQQEPVNPSHTS